MKDNTAVIGAHPKAQLLRALARLRSARTGLPLSALLAARTTVMRRP